METLDSLHNIYIIEHLHRVLDKFIPIFEINNSYVGKDDSQKGILVAVDSTIYSKFKTNKRKIS